MAQWGYGSALYQDVQYRRFFSYSRLAFPFPDPGVSSQQPTMYCLNHDISLILPPCNMFRQPPPFVLKFHLELWLLRGIWVMERIKGESCWKRLVPVFANLWVVVVAARAGADSSPNLILCDGVMSMQWGYGTIHSIQLSWALTISG